MKLSIEQLHIVFDALQGAVFELNGNISAAREGGMPDALVLHWEQQRADVEAVQEIVAQALLSK